MDIRSVVAKGNFIGHWDVLFLSGVEGYIDINIFQNTSDVRFNSMYFIAHKL